MTTKGHLSPTARELLAREDRNHPGTSTGTGSVPVDQQKPEHNDPCGAEVVPVPTPGTGTGTTLGTTPPTAPYFDVASLLAGNLPEPPKPTIMRRTDGVGLFYEGQFSLVFGDPECGKTWLALCAIAQVLTDGGRALFIDLDHNGAVSIITRLLNLGVPVETLGDLARFRYIEPGDTAELFQVVQDCQEWRPDLVGIDSLGELLPMFRASSNNGDDFTAVHARIIKPLVRVGAAVVVIDHLAKGTESRQTGPTGSPAKRRAVGGVSLRVRAKEAFTPGRGGTAYVLVNKDRHGGLRAASPTGDREPLAAVFTLHPESGDELTFSLRPARDGEQAPADHAAPDLVAKIAALDPPPKSANDAAARIGGQRQAVLAAYREWQQNLGGTGSGGRYRNQGTTPDQGVYSGGSRGGTSSGTTSGTTSVPRCSACREPMTFAGDVEAGRHAACAEGGLK